MLFFSEEGENDGEDEAQQDAGRDREIKGEASLPQKDIPGELAEHRDLREDRCKNAHPDQDDSKKDECFSEVVHALSP
jgi:hypothetical protein